VKPGFAVDRPRCGFRPVVVFPPSDPVSNGVGRHSGFGPLLPTRSVDVLMSTGMIASVPYANESGVSRSGYVWWSYKLRALRGVSPSICL